MQKVNAANLSVSCNNVRQEILYKLTQSIIIQIIIVCILCFWFQVLGFRFQVLGFRFQVLGFRSNSEPRPNPWLAFHCLSWPIHPTKIYDIIILILRIVGLSVLCPLRDTQFKSLKHAANIFFENNKCSKERQALCKLTVHSDIRTDGHSNMYLSLLTKKNLLMTLEMP